MKVLQLCSAPLLLQQQLLQLDPTLVENVTLYNKAHLRFIGKEESGRMSASGEKQQKTETWFRPYAAFVGRGGVFQGVLGLVGFSAQGAK